MKLFLFLCVLLGMIYAVYGVTRSVLLSILSGLAFLIFWLFQANIRKIFTSGPFKSFFDSYAEKVKFPEQGIYAEGLMYLGNLYDACGVTVDKAGIYVFSAGVCECRIPWKFIENTSFKKINESLVTQLQLFNGFEKNSELILPWRNEFFEFIESHQGQTP